MRATLFASIFFWLIASSMPASAQLNIQAIDAAGDSITKGFNAGNSFPCSNGDQENYNWLTSDTHGSNFCGRGNENVFSVFERLECDTGTNLFAPSPNHAASGATLVGNFVSQAANVKTYLLSQNVQRMAVVFLGHNDNCSGNNSKANSSCSNPDLDPANYCKTKPASFERELRKGLDTLMSIPNTRVGVAAPVRVSQLCNFGSKSNCQISGSCTFLWGLVNICGPLTSDCSPQRVIDTYTTMKGYRDILKSVESEYEAIPVGGNSNIVMIGGEMVGGGVKASGVTFAYTDAAWVYRFNSDQISCCDCFHPSNIGQNVLAQMMKNGLMCSRLNPCCKDTGDALSDGKCATTQRKQAYFRGLF